MALNVWTQPSGFSFGVFEEQVTLETPQPSGPPVAGIALPVVNDAGVVYSVISGALPSGVFLIGNRLVGAPYVVDNILNYVFCIRANLNNLDYSDRTFGMSVTGVDAPVFITPEGNLDAGVNHQFYTLDGSYVNYQLDAVDLNVDDGQVLTFYIESGLQDNGELPPGLTLSRSGLISGFITPSLTSSNERNHSYTFVVTVTDGINFATREFTIFVVVPNQFRADSTTSDGLAGDFTADSTYVTTPVWLTPSDLGIYRANNYVTIPVDLYDNRNTTFRIETTNTEVYAVTYQVGLSNLSSTNKLTVTNTSSVPQVNHYLTFENYVQSASNTVYRITAVTELSEGVYELTLASNLSLTLDNGTPFYMGTLSALPTGLSFDTATSELYGVIPYQPAITKTFKFTVTASRTEFGSSSSINTSRTFTVSILGDITSEIIWNTPANLGTLSANYVSTLSINASSTITDTIMNYEVVSGALPPGLSLSNDGSIIGSVNQFYSSITGQLGLIIFDSGETTFDNNTTTFDRSYKFTIQASDQYGYSASSREFTITIDTPNVTEYSDIITRPFLEKSQRTAWISFITDTSIFTPSSIYRPNDSNFGLQTNLAMVVYAGIESVTATNYITSMQSGFKRKRLHFNSIQKALAIDPNTGESVYEVVYAKLHDPLEPNNDRLPIDVNGYHINSISNWRDRLVYGDGIKSTTSDNLSSERNYLPLWMRTIQAGTKEQLGFTLAVPLCYCKVGQADDIILNIKYSGFDFKTLDYTVDRFILKEITGDKYLAFRTDSTNDRETI